MKQKRLISARKDRFQRTRKLLDSLTRGRVMNQGAECGLRGENEVVARLVNEKENAFNFHLYFTLIPFSWECLTVQAKAHEVQTT